MTEALLDATATRERYILAACASYMGSLSIGMALGYSSPTKEEILKEFSDSFNFSLFGSLITLGALSGGLLAGLLTENFGRKGAILSTTPIFAIGWIFIIVAKADWLMHAARFLMGISTGVACMAVPVYIGEISTSERRGILGTGHQFTIVTGILITFLLGAVTHYKLLAACCMVPVVLLTIAMIFMPESPIYLVKRRRSREEVMAAIHFLYGKTMRAEAQYELINNASLDIDNNDFTISDIASPSVLRPLALALMLMLFQQLSGINAVIFYTATIFDSAGTPMSASLESIIAALVQVIFTVPAAILIDRAGRRILLHISGSVMLVGLTLLGLFYYLKHHNDGVASHLGWLPITALSLYIAGFSVGYGPIAWLMMGELLPSRARGFGTGICTAFNWFCAFLVTKFFEDLVKAVGNDVVFWMFGCIVLTGIIAVIFLLPETKGKSLEEIEAMFSAHDRGESVSTVDDNSVDGVINK